VLVKDIGQTCLAKPDADGNKVRTLRPLQAAAVTYRIAFGPRAGQKVLTLRRCRRKQHLARYALIEAFWRGVLDDDEDAKRATGAPWAPTLAER
jgi:hypothetical protein